MWVIQTKKIPIQKITNKGANHTIELKGLKCLSSLAYKTLYNLEKRLQITILNFWGFNLTLTSILNVNNTFPKTTVSLWGRFSCSKEGCNRKNSKQQASRKVKWNSYDNFWCCSEPNWASQLSWPVWYSSPQASSINRNTHPVSQDSRSCALELI